MAKISNSEYWKQAIDDQLSSGLTQVKWCEKNNVNIHNFRYWKNRIKNDKILDQVSTAPTWALVAAKPEHTEFETGQIDMKIGKVNLTLRNSVDLNFLSDVIKVLMNYA